MTNGETKVRCQYTSHAANQAFWPPYLIGLQATEYQQLNTNLLHKTTAAIQQREVFHVYCNRIVFALSCTCTSDFSRVPVVPCLPVSGGNLKTHRWGLLHALNRHFVAHERPDVVDSVSVDSVTRLQSGCNCQNRTHLIIVGRSSEIPHPCTCTSGGKPMGSSISGRNMPLFPTSTHLFSIG